MNNLGNKLLVAIVLAGLLFGLLPITVYAAESSDIVIGNNYTLSSGETLNDDLLILGGNVTLMNNSTINGNVILLGGNLSAAGTITGDVVVLGGSVALSSTFILNGNLSTAGATLNRQPGAQINGQVYSERDAPRIFTLPGGIRLTNLGDTTHPLLRVASFFLRLFLWVLLAMVVAMFIPKHLSQTSSTALTEPVTSGGMGCLTIIIAPILIILLAITICLIPIALLVAFALAAAWAFGLISLGLEVGKRINAMTNQQWHPVVTAGLGMLILMLVLNGLEAIIPCVGWIPKALVGLLGLGAVILTQFGMKPYPNAGVLPAPNPVDVLPPQIPTNDSPPDVPGDDL